MGKYTNNEQLTAESREASYMKRLLTKRYIIALTLIAALLTTNYALLQHTIKQQRDDAKIINISGKQRMLSQKIAFLANQMITTKDVIERQRARQQLRLTVQNFSDSHQGLSKGSKSMELPAPESLKLQQMYFEKPMDLDQKARTYIENVNSLIDEPAETLNRENPYYQYIAASAQILLESLHAVVNQYEFENKQKLATLKKIETAVYISSLIALLLEALVIFRPTVKRIGSVQQHMETVNRMKAEFIANMSHEIRTPMNSIFGNGELLMQSELNENQRTQAQNLLNSADDLLNMIDDVLDFSKIEAGKLTLEPIKFDLQSALEDVADLLSPKALEKRVDLMVRYNPDTPRFVVADPGRVRQVITHLLENALKFTDEGYVMLTASVLDKQGKDYVLKISLEDTGAGIAKEVQKTIFEKFRQADMSMTKQHGGTGLGLAIAEQIVRLMKGKIGVESKLGEGSTFWFTIPVKQAATNEHVITPKTLKDLKVLVVDDIAANRELLHEQLSTAGMQVALASCGREALQQLRSAQQTGNRFDMVVSDYIMPTMDGEYLTNIIRQEKPITDTPVIVLTSAGEKGFAKRFAEVGVTAYASKPVRTDSLLDLLSNVWQQYSSGNITTPITVHTSKASKTQAVLAERVDPFKGVRLLLVEDNRANRDFTRQMLENMDFYVTEAVNGQDALNKLRNDIFDIILMDCQMPVMDGFIASQKITRMKAAGDMPNTPVIALTANALAGDRERCLKAGMDDYISKPILLKKLENTVVKWLGDKINDDSLSVMPAAKQKIEPKQDTIFVKKPAMERIQHKLQQTEHTIEQVLEETATSLINMETFDGVKSLMGAKFTKMMAYYLEDSQDYIDQIKIALTVTDVEGLITPAHSIKAASEQFGIQELADLAAKIELLAKSSESSSTVIQQSNTLVIELEKKFHSVVPEIKKLSAA